MIRPFVERFVPNAEGPVSRPFVSTYFDCGTCGPDGAAGASVTVTSFEAEAMPLLGPIVVMPPNPVIPEVAVMRYRPAAIFLIW